MAVDTLGTHIAKAKNDNAGQIGTTGRKKVTKVQIMRQEDMPFLTRLFQYLRIPESVEALLLKVDRVMPQMLKEVNYLRRDAHVC